MSFILADDAYWLSFGKAQIENAIKSRDEASKSLDTFLTAIWTIYTTAIAINFVFNKSDYELWQTILMCLPVLLIPITKYFYIQVQMPVLDKFYPNQPKSIQNYYTAVVKEKSNRLKLALVFTVVSVLSISVALACFKIKIDHFYVKKENNKWLYHGRSEKNANIMVRLLFVGNTYIEDKSTITDDNGLFSYIIDLEKIKPKKSLDSISKVYFFNKEIIIPEQK